MQVFDLSMPGCAMHLLLSLQLTRSASSKEGNLLCVLWQPARAIDSTLLNAIGKLATEQVGCTKTMIERRTQLLNYCATTHPNATICFAACNMLLVVESDDSYLSIVTACSRATAGYFYLTSKPAKPTNAFMPNGAFHILCHIMRKVLSNAAEADKLDALFHNGKEACPPPHHAGGDSWPFPTGHTGDGY